MVSSYNGVALYCVTIATALACFIVTTVSLLCLIINTMLPHNVSYLPQKGFNVLK